MAVRKCQWCGKPITSKDVIGINKKIINEKCTEMYCLDCMTEYCGCTVEDIEQKIVQFKEEGCKLFQ